MHVLFLTWRDVEHPLAGGSEVLIDQLAAGLHDRGHRVTVLANGPLREHRYEAIDSGGRLRQYLTDPLRVRRDHRDVDVIVDVCNGIPFFAPLWSPVPVVSLVNHIHFGMWREWFPRPVAWLGATVETRLMPWLYRRRPIVAVSESTATALESLGIERDHITIVHNGIDIPPDSPDRAVQPVFVALGRLVPHKRFDLLLRAWERVRPVTGGTLVIAGDGPLRAELERAAPPGTEFVGRISEAEKRDLLGRAWFLIQPSRLEGWGLVVLEAAALSTPTIGFWVPGTRDAVVHDETGILVRTELELVGAWAALAGDDEQRRLLEKGARARAEQFGWDRTVDAFEEVLERAVLRPRLARRPAPPRRPHADRRHELQETIELLRLFRHEKHDPEPFYRRIADRSVAELSLPIDGKTILDLASGPGHYSRALRDRGAQVVPVEMDADAWTDAPAPDDATRADGTRLPFPDQSFDGVFCSNMLEHTPDVPAVLAEIGRVLKPGGWAWVSWTNWYSPWGGHEIVPFHYLGPDRGLRAWRRLFGEPRKNIPFEELWPTHIGDVMRATQREPSLDLRDSYPRYYPSQRWITRVPGVRELLSWNCVLVLERNDLESIEPMPDLDTTSSAALGRRSLRRIRRWLGDRPAFLPVVLRATPLGTSRRIQPDTELVVEGFPRSGNTFAYQALRVANPSLRVTSRVHTPSQVKLAVRRRVPTLFVIREPVDAIASLVVAVPHVPLRQALLEYIHHHDQLVPLIDQMVIATFDEVTDDFGVVVDELNERYHLGLHRFEHDPDSVRKVFATIDTDHRAEWGLDQDHLLPRPDPARGELQQQIRRELLRVEHASLLAEAQTIYDVMADASVTNRLAR